ncbi:MAG: hypothetical protein Q7R93_03910 [bacterium]|nr:hypothetical protein [bacterium]
MNIPELRQKVKDTAGRLNTKEIFTMLLILVVGFGSFGLGRLSKLQEGKTPIRIEQAAAVALSPLAKGVSEASPTGVVSSSVKGQLSPVTSPDAPAAGGQLVGSKGGTKYHFPWCSGAQRISEANKIWFNSVEEAQKAGYTPAANCKGLR